jgi:hypothetical protein
MIDPVRLRVISNNLPFFVHFFSFYRWLIIFFLFELALGKLEEKERKGQERKNSKNMKPWFMKVLNPVNWPVQLLRQHLDSHHPK